MSTDDTLSDLRNNAARLLQLGWQAREIDQPGYAHWLFQQSLEAAESSGDARGTARAILALADNAVLFYPSDDENTFERYERLARAALEHFREIGDDEGIADAQRLLAPMLPQQEGVREFEESIALARRIGYSSGIILGLLRLGQLVVIADRKQGLGFMREALEIARQMDRKRDIAQVLVSIGMLSDEGPAERRALFEEAHALYRELGSKGSLARTLQMAARSCGGLDLDSDDALLEESLALCRELDSAAMEASCLRQMARIAEQRGDQPRSQALDAERAAKESIAETLAGELAQGEVDTVLTWARKRFG